MKFSKTISISVIALCAATVLADDSKCRRRRGFHDPGPDQQLLEDGITEDDIQSRDHDMEQTAAAFPVEKKSRLRGSHRSNDVTTFQLKMYHEDGYCWQEEWDDKRWCLECEGSSCGTDDYLWIKRCDEDDKKQRFVWDQSGSGGGGRLKPYTRQDLCWERTRVNAHQLRPCDGSEPKQLIHGLEYSGKFEMHPNGRPDDCLEQHHHPKAEEVVRANDCESSRADKTSYWEMINVGTGSSGGGNNDDDDDDDDPPPPAGSTTINYLGREKCDRHTCNLCQGDCDDDSQCAGDLRCFQREGNEPVPGCDGGDGSETRGKDFCYDPDATKHHQGSTMINYLGREYCDQHTCGVCQGDCDRDSQCAGNLKCFQRDRNEPVPGCSGGDGSDTRGKDFCYDPTR